MTYNGEDFSWNGGKCWKTTQSLGLQEHESWRVCIGDMYVTNKSIFVIICWNDFLRLRGIDMNWWCHIYAYLPLMYTSVCSTSQICLYKGIYSNQRAIAFLLWTRRASTFAWPRAERNLERSSDRKPWRHMLPEDFHWIMSHDRDSFIATWMFETVDICELFSIFSEKSSS